MWRTRPQNERALARVRNLDLALTRILDLVSGSDLTRARAHASGYARSLASVSAAVLISHLGIEDSDGLADALLNGALDDFSQADLSGVNLADFDLTGIRWSVLGTRWPPGLDAEALMRQSEETEPGSGIFVVTRREERP